MFVSSSLHHNTHVFLFICSCSCHLCISLTHSFIQGPSIAREFQEAQHTLLLAHFLASPRACFNELMVAELFRAACSGSIALFPRSSGEADVHVGKTCIIYNTSVLKTVLLNARVWKNAPARIRRQRLSLLATLIDGEATHFSTFNAAQLRCVCNHGLL